MTKAINSMVNVTSDDVKEFWKYMSKKYKFDIVTKSDAVEMKIVGWALDQMGILDKNDFLKKYATTICLGSWRCVYVPFEIGKGGITQLIAQVETCVHESQHMVQADRDPLYAIKYLSSDTNRTYYEVDAYRTNMELHYFFTGKLISPKAIADTLAAYSIGLADRRIAEKHLTVAAKIVQRGGVVTNSSKVSIRWWSLRKKSSNLRKMTTVKL